MTTEEEFETLKGDYIQKSQVHLKELQGLHINDFDKITTPVDVALTQLAASLSFLSLSMFIKNYRKERQHQTM